MRLFPADPLRGVGGAVPPRPLRGSRCPECWGCTGSASDRPAMTSEGAPPRPPRPRGVSHTLPHPTAAATPLYGVPSNRCKRCRQAQGRGCSGRRRRPPRGTAPGVGASAAPAAASPIPEALLPVAISSLGTLRRPEAWSCSKDRRGPSRAVLLRV
ncbi:uncharacterized protein LOC119873960 [Canis lupus familiaris]|uniref:uncharacterized protein LOC119873960 n=1 Tax=Canis lupus familiaris TaxID=9615 RepID=UPI0018F4F551|nr:uncharacterized protein LOC119873960 [Canis lupus familiaris]